MSDDGASRSVTVRLNTSELAALELLMRDSGRNQSDSLRSALKLMYQMRRLHQHSQAGCFTSLHPSSQGLTIPIIFEEHEHET